MNWLVTEPTELATEWLKRRRSDIRINKMLTEKKSGGPGSDLGNKEVGQAALRVAPHFGVPRFDHQ